MRKVKKVKKKPAKKKTKAEWLPMDTRRNIGDWLGQWMISNVMITSYSRTGKFPSHIKFMKIKELPSGGADLVFEVRYSGD